MEYAQIFVPEDQSPVELYEGKSDNDEIFWVMLGGEDYAKADYWRWRKEAPTTDPIVWRVQTETDAVVRLACYPNNYDGSLYYQITRIPLIPRTDFHERVYIIDCIWEFFILVGSKARSRRQDIRLGLIVASVRLHMPVVKVEANVNGAENVQEAVSQSAIPTNGTCSSFTVTATVRSATEFS